MSARAPEPRQTGPGAGDAVTPPGGPLDAAAAGAFLLLVAVLPGSIAPMGIATGLCGALTVAAMVARRRASWPRTPVDLPAFGWMAALMLSSAFALDPAGSWPRITKGLFPLLVGMAAIHGRDRRTGERAIATYLVTSALVSVIGVALWVSHGASFSARARGLSGHYMTFAGQLALVLPVAFAVAVGERRRRWRWLAAASAALGLAALAVTFTRSAWIGTVVAGAVIAAAWSPLAVGAITVVAVAAYFLAPGMIGTRLRSIFDPHNPWNQQREFMWQAGWHMFRDHPAMGVGLQDLHALYDQYRSPLATERAGHLHDVYVQIAAQMGAVGLAAFTWLYASFARATLPLRRGGGPPRGLGASLRVGVLATLAGFLVAGLFEWNFGDEELLYALYTLVGLAWASRDWDDAT